MDGRHCITPRLWRQRLESAAAGAAGIAVLDATATRLWRWDMHPGVQGGPEAPVGRLANRFDCAHSSLAPGSFDGEVWALRRALLAEAAR